jgi:hypothetical protein
MVNDAYGKYVYEHVPGAMDALDWPKTETPFAVTVTGTLAVCMAVPLLQTATPKSDESPTRCPSEPLVRFAPAANAIAETLTTVTTAKPTPMVNLFINSV